MVVTIIVFSLYSNVDKKSQFPFFLNSRPLFGLFFFNFPYVWIRPIRISVEYLSNRDILNLGDLKVSVKQARKEEEEVGW